MAPSGGYRHQILTMIAVIIYLSISGCQTAQVAKSRYVMDRRSDCTSIGVLDVERGKTTFIQARSFTPEATPQLSCTLQFSPQSRGDTLKMWFESGANIGDCEVSLSIQMTDNQAMSTSHGYRQQFQMGCLTKRDPPKMEARDGRLYIGLSRRSYATSDYSFQIGVRAEKSVSADDGSGTGSDLDIGVIVGIVCGVIAFIVIIVIVCVCCYLSSKRSDKTQPNNVPTAENYKYENKMLQNSGNSVEGSPSSGRRLLGRNENDDSLRGKSALDRFGAVEPRQTKKPRDTYDTIDVEAGQQEKKVERRDQPAAENGRRSPLLSDLQRNPKFRRSFHENEIDAQDRANRAYTSENDNSIESFDSRGVPRPPRLPAVPKSPPRSPSPHRRGEKIAMISRDRPLSSSSGHLEKNGSSEEFSDDDRHRGKRGPSRHVLKPDRKGRKSRGDEEDDSEDERRRRKKERERKERKRQEEEEEEAEERRRRKKEERRRREEDEDERERKHRHDKDQDDDRYEGRFKKSASGRKSKGKGPRKGRSRSTGNALDEMEDNYQRSRSKSPSSVRSLNFVEVDDDDLDSNYMPFKRSSSKTSLYASRSSLYGRRRKNSMGETISLSSYAIDDADSRVGDFDNRGLNLNRRERDRMFKSTGELEMHTATAQVVRECTTQTGVERAVQIYGRKTIAKSRPGRMYSRGTQTGVGRERRDSTGSARSGKSGRSSRSNARLKHKSKSMESLRKDRRSRSRHLDDSDDSDDRRSRKSRSKSKGLDYSDDDDDDSRKGKRKHHRSKSRGLDDDDDRQSSRGARSKPRARPRKSTGAASVDLSDSDLASEGGRSAAPSSIAASMAHPPPQHLPNPYGAQYVPVMYPQGQVAYMPTAPGGPPMASYMPGAGAKPPVGPKPTIAPKPQKSKWDTLVAMTDGEKQRQRQNDDTITETESMFSMYSPSADGPHVGNVYAPPSYTTAQRFPHPNVMLSSNNSSDIPSSARGPRNYKLDTNSYAPSESVI